MTSHRDTSAARAAAPGRDAPPLLRMSGITKRFPGVLANDDVELTVRRGEIHALLGENGAGKSTLMNILYGLHQPDAGTIELEGRRVAIRSPRAALELGIGMVHQHFMLVPDMTAAENMALVTTVGRIKRSHVRRVAARIAELAEQHRLPVDPDALVADLSVGQQQRLEILKLLYCGADLFVLDEPTAVLTPPEWRELAGVLRDLAQAGHGIVLITHKLDEVLEASDRCTVLRDSTNVATVDVATTDARSLARMMVGRDVTLRAERVRVERGDVVLEVAGLHAQDDGDQPALRDVSLSVHGGEVLGIAGVDGNGQRELVEVLTGLRAPTAGTIAFSGQPVAALTPTGFAALGGAVVPENRHRNGVALGLDLEENLLMKDYARAPFARRGLLRPQARRVHCERLVRDYDIRARGLDVQLRQLSGGNQQKTVLARELHGEPRLLIAAQPTRGLDVGAMEFVYGRVNEHKVRGGATLLVSAELEEILSLSDRIAVMFEGRVMAVLDADGVDRETVGLLMAGKELAR